MNSSGPGWSRGPTNEHLQYATTWGYHRLYSEEPDDPREPEGTGWTLVGFAAADDCLYWTWQRPVKCRDEERAAEEDPPSR